MDFRKLCRSVDTDNFIIQSLNPIVLKAQYNPQRFHLWKRLHKGPKGEELTMLYSPHYRLLKGDETYYRKLQQSYGRNAKWIQGKINKFRSVYKNISENGFTENLMILETPLVTNEHNGGYEIFEGHHRVSCALDLSIDLIPCEVIRMKR